MAEIDFKYGMYIRTGPKYAEGGKWDAELNDWIRNARKNAVLTISIGIHFIKINPAKGKESGLYGDADDGDDGKPSKKKIQKWAPTEFEQFKQNLLSSAQRFWSGKFWLETPDDYDELDVVEHKQTYRPNLFCKLELTDALSVGDAHYTIAVVRAADDVNFRSDSVLYSQNDINSEQLIPHSTTKFWTHFHEVGHLLGLGHVNHKDMYNGKGLNDRKAYGVTKAQMSDVMGMGSARHKWHADPWRQAAAKFTNTIKGDWRVHMQHLAPIIMVD